MQPLFTSSSKSLLYFRRLAVTILFIGLAVIVVDQIIEFVFADLLHCAPYVIPEAPHEAQLRVGLEKFWKLLSQGTHPIVFSGSSMMASDLSPSKFDEGVSITPNANVTSVNMSALGSHPSYVHSLFKYVILPEHPEMFFYGIELRALNSDDSSSFSPSSPLGYSLSQESQFMRSVSLFLLRHSGFVRYRDVIQGFFSTGTFNNYASMVDFPGFIFSSQILKGRESSFHGLRWPFPKASSVQHEALKQIAQECREYQVQCVFIGLPLSEEAYKYVFPEESARYQTELNAIVKDTQVPIWNFDTPECRTLLDSTLFSDFNHLNGNGTNIFSSMVASLYLQRIENYPGDKDLRTDCVKILTP